MKRCLVPWHISTTLLLLTLCIEPFLTAPRVWGDEGAPHERAYKHRLTKILGATTALESDETAFTYGLDYEYIFSRRFGAGLVVERAGGDIATTSIFAVIDLHLTNALVVQFGPGIEFEDDHDGSVAVGRIGVYYDLEVGPLTVSPAVSYDFSEREDAVVYGLLVGREF